MLSIFIDYSSRHNWGEISFRVPSCCLVGFGQFLKIDKSFNGEPDLISLKASETISFMNSS